jgi:hypothetical protein
VLYLVASRDCLEAIGVSNPYPDLSKHTRETITGLEPWERARAGLVQAHSRWVDKCGWVVSCWQPFTEQPMATTNTPAYIEVDRLAGEAMQARDYTTAEQLYGKLMSVFDGNMKAFYRERLKDARQSRKDYARYLDSREGLYRQGVEWIALNDEPTLTDWIAIQDQISVVLLADMFGVSPTIVAQHIVRLREDPKAIGIVPLERKGV